MPHRGACVDMLNKNGWTPLLKAASSNSAILARLFMPYGARAPFALRDV